MSDLSNLTVAQQRSRANLKPFKPGQSGNPAGRPKSARSRLSESFLKALADDFEANGAEAVIAARTKNPGEYLRVISALQPKQIEGSEDGPPIKTVNKVELVAPAHVDSKD